MNTPGDNNNIFTAQPHHLVYHMIAEQLANGAQDVITAGGKQSLVRPCNFTDNLCHYCENRKASKLDDYVAFRATAILSAIYSLCLSLSAGFILSLVSQFVVPQENVMNAKIEFHKHCICCNLKV